MHLARHFWNTCRSSIKRKLERALLLDSLNELIHHINTVAPKSIVGSRSEKETVFEKKRAFCLSIIFDEFLERRKSKSDRRFSTEETAINQ